MTMRPPIHDFVQTQLHGLHQHRRDADRRTVSPFPHDDFHAALLLSILIHRRPTEGFPGPASQSMGDGDGAGGPGSGALSAGHISLEDR